MKGRKGREGREGMEGGERQGEGDLRTTMSLRSGPKLSDHETVNKKDFI